MNNNIENRFKRVPSLEEKKQLDLVTEEVLALYLKNQEGTKLHSLRTDHEVHLELLKQKKDERLTKNMRDLIKLLAMDFFKENNRIPDGIDLWDKVKKETTNQNEKVA